ncbi:carbohydrate ABC transporter permease [uncultured Roseibium sp.]|uniref:carbohydrate ABC transporter permease n=1 Tax=uncultured Roseibium sp. TaxID=1936171 RepID=UPI00262EA9B6|nr:carbohydrate ABC transporter permease [uncultured Roseibium sp.]
MARIVAFLTRTRAGKGRMDWTDWVTYGYLLFGIVLMFGPVAWLLLSSFKTGAELERFPPRLLPVAQDTLVVESYDEPLPLFKMIAGDQEGRTLAQIRRVGLIAQMVDPAEPETRLKVNVADREPIERIAFAWNNYTDLFERLNFPLYLWNSTAITLTATAIMLVINSMAAFALSKYKFRGKLTVLALVIGTLMVPGTVLLVPTFLLVSQFGMVNTLWGVIIPGAATPTGVFLLRQYMITIPDEILDAARMDSASEWKIFWRIIIPLSAPAIAVLAILAIMWRWNDFLWPLIVLSENDKFTLQLALNSFQGEFLTDWEKLLPATVLTLLPVAIVFMFLQKYIATGIASTGGK